MKAERKVLPLLFKQFIKTRILLLSCACLGLSACAGSFYEAQSRQDATEVNINGRVVRVVDLGDKVEMIRKGYLHGGQGVEHWEDFIAAGKKVTGCDIVNIVPRPGMRDSLVWVQAMKKCK